MDMYNSLLPLVSNSEIALANNINKINLMTSTYQNHIKILK